MSGWTVPGYTEIRVLGTGEAGRIVEAVHDTSGVRVTVTQPGPALCADQAFRERLRGEAELLTGLEHPNVVRVRDLVETGTDVALITEAVEGAALRRVLESSGPLSPEAALAVLRASLLGLGAAAEAGVAHRDYQPSNVVVTGDGVVKVGGFGLAARTEAMMPAAGTASYMAPELWEGAAARSVTDLYAVAATFYECLTGRVPYSTDSMFELQTMHRAAPIPVADVPAALAPLVAQGLAKDPADRPATAARFVAELDAAAVVEFGMEWEDRGRRELAAVVAALPEEGGAGDAPTSVMADAAAQLAADEAAGGAAGAGMGRGTKIGIATAAVAVIGAVVAAMAFSSGKHTAAAAGSSSEIVTVATDQDSSSGEGAAPGVAGAAPSPDASGADHSSPTKATTGGPATATSAPTGGTTPGTTETPIGLPPPSLSSTPSLPNFPPTSMATSGPTTPSGSTVPPTTPSTAVTVSASATMTKSSYSGPCPPSDPPTGTVTFSVSGLPAGGSVTITYHWRVAGATGSGGSGQVVARSNGDFEQPFTVTTDQHSPKGMSGAVEVTWSAPGTSGGSTSAGSVDITCTPGSGGTSGGGPGGG